MQRLLRRRSRGNIASTAAALLALDAVNARVIAIIPTFRRAALLGRALESLRNQGAALSRVIVVNNSSDEDTRNAVRLARVPTSVLDLGRNLGVAGGIALGLREFLRDPLATHAWILDDDMIVTPGALVALLRACERANAGAVAPVATDHAGIIRWFPGPLPGPAWDLVRSAPSAERFAAALGAELLPWNWASWAGLLVARHAVEVIGFPRLDLWFSYTDFEYTLRISTRFRCVLAPDAAIEHAQPPKPVDVDASQRRWALRNGWFVSVRLRHGWRFLRHMPGHSFRHLIHHQWGPRAWWEIAQAFVVGAVLGRLEGPVQSRDDYEKAVRLLHDSK